MESSKAVDFCNMEIPENLRYTTDHEWIKFDGDVATLGVTDYAQDALGDVVYVGLPAVDSEFGAGDPLAEVESTKSVSDVFAPVSGTVVAVNEALTETPEHINSSPYEQGWICKLRVVPGDADQLLDAKGYRDLLEQG